MSTIQRSQTIVTKFVDDDAGGLRLEKPTKDPGNDRARVGQATALRREQSEPKEIYHISWDSDLHSPNVEIGTTKVGLFFQGEVYDQADNLVGRYHRLAPFRLGDDDADQEAVLFFF